ncbi:MAG: hypothetical protein J3Q66DRAFT_389203 [Benniella sp.]|nr:MAG: hypothetical protein J3Q66DRAFT_389203 [Benniella sp.]
MESFFIGATVRVTEEWLSVSLCVDSGISSESITIHSLPLPLQILSRPRNDHSSTFATYFERPSLRKSLFATTLRLAIVIRPLLSMHQFLLILSRRPSGDQEDHRRVLRAGSDVTTFLEDFVRGTEEPTTHNRKCLWFAKSLASKNGPRDDTRPSLLFSNLPHPPSSGDIPGRYPTSDAILQLIERCISACDYTVPIFGVSGCGKTRGMIELLSRRWGFYFNAAADDLGSRDITTLISDIGRGLQSDREANNRQARTATYLLLLSRLKILQHCLTISGSHQTFTSARWTILQTCPYVLFDGIDIFAQLFELFLPILDQYQTPLTESGLVKAVQSEFQATRHLLEEHGRQGGLPSFSNRDRLLVVHDEAQLLGDRYEGRFSSMARGEPDRPLLSPILWGFRTISETNLTLITSGTGLSIYTLDWARSSGSINKSNRSLTGQNGFEYMEFPGWTGRESIEAYVAGLRCLLPTEGARQALDRLLPSEAIHAITERLVGRFRPAVTAIEKTIARSEPDGWKGALDDTEARLVSYDYRSEPGNLCHEIVRLENKYRDNLSILKELQTVEEVLGLLLFQRHMFGADRLVFDEAVPEWQGIPLNVRKLADQAEIVGMESRDFSADLNEHIQGGFMEAHAKNKSLRKAKPSGPDIVFYIRVNGNLFPVFVQLKLRQVLTTKGAKSALKTVSAPMIEAHVEDFDHFCPTDKTYISMIIAYPATVAAKLPPRPDFAYNLRARPDPKPERLKQVKVIIDKSNINKIFPQSHIDFLDGIKGPMKRPAEDTQEAENPKKTRL